jgi:putative ABC transport system permease protein
MDRNDKRGRSRLLSPLRNDNRGRAHDDDTDEVSHPADVNTQSRPIVITVVETLMWEVRCALRSLRRSRGVAAAAVATLALGMGATTTMFSVVDAMLWRPVALPDAERLAILYVTKTTARDGLQRLRWSRPKIGELEDAAAAFESVASFTTASVSVADQSQVTSLPEQVDAEVVSPSYFHTLRVDAETGRVFSADEDVQPGGHPVAIIGHSLWQRHVPEPWSAGRVLRVNDVPLTIVGVLPPTFHGLSGRAEVWIPRVMAPKLTYSDYLVTPQHFIMVVARLKPGVDFRTANAELSAAGGRFADERSDEGAQWGAVARPLGDARIDITARQSGLALLAAAGAVLLIACVNVACLMLARYCTRHREIAVRLAIGSSRWQIVRLLLTEGMLIALGSTAGGLLLAAWGISFFNRAGPAIIPSGRNDYASLGAFAVAALDLHSFAFAAVATICATLIFAMAPAVGVTRRHLVPALKETDRPGGQRVLTALVVLETAMAVVLLIGATLFLDRFARIERNRIGFDASRVLTFWVRPPNSTYSPSAGPAIIERLLARIAQTPGVESAAVNRCVPFTGCARTTVVVAGQPEDPRGRSVVGRHYVSADYFRTLGIPLRSGRTLTPGDRMDRRAVAVVNETAARRFWPDQSPIGQRVFFGSGTGFVGPEHTVEVVGVVGDVKYEGVDEPVNADFYTSYLQFSYPDTMVMVKVRGSSSQAVASLRAAVSSVDAALPIFDVLSLDDRIDGALARPRFNATIVGLFAMAALTLAAIGVYGMSSYSVAVRSRDIGIRMALGADGRRVFRLVIRHGLRAALAGVAAGVATSLIAAPLLRGLLVGIGESDPRLLAAGAGAMLIVATIATALPARRAARVDPMIVLRE